MKRFYVPFLIVLGLMPLALPAQAANLPIGEDTRWYVHANLLEMRQTPAGTQLYDWVRREVIEDLEEEFEISLAGELDGVTVFGNAPGHESGAVVLHGFLSAATREAVLAKAREEAQLTADELFGRPFYAIGPLEENEHGHFDGGFLAFGDSGQTLITENRGLLEQFLSAGAHFAGSAPTGLLVIEAENPLVQGGLDASGMNGEGGPWESHMFQNVEQLALVIADDNGLLDIQARITALTADMAQAIGNIVQGMISLKAVSDNDPQAAALLSRLKMETEDRTVKLRLSIEPETVLEILD